MSNETKQEIYLYLKDFINQKGEHSEYIDYYQMFNLDKSMSVQEIKDSLKEKKVRKLFHPDQVAYIDDELRDVYNQSIEQVTEMNNVFSSEKSKKEYDDMLVEKNKLQNQNRFYTTSSAQTSTFSPEEEMILENAITHTIHKYGFYQGYGALQKAMKNDFSSVTNDNNYRSLLSSIGGDKINNIIMSKKVDIMDSTPSNMLMDYYSYIIEKDEFKLERDAFYNMCMETAKKYELTSSKGQLNFALGKFIEDKDASSFTNNNNARSNFKNSRITPNDARVLMASSVHRKGYNNPDYLFSNYRKKSVGEQINMFSDVTIAKAKSDSTHK